MRLTLRILSLLLVLSVTGTAFGASQRKVPAYEKYIKQYSGLAVQHQKKYRIPASITLAQGLLESGAGRSELARKSNNHFGIKCHSDWRGGRIYHDDDLRGECFRKYSDPKQSYEDHARFLVDRPRYASLFKLKITDYKGWARGLQKCGYATDRAYANRLIKLIEDYDLYRYDTAKSGKKTGKQPTRIARYTVYRTNGLLYVHSNGRDNFDDIAASLGFQVKDLKIQRSAEDFRYRKRYRLPGKKKKKGQSPITTMSYK